MIKTNIEQLVEMSVMGEISHPSYNGEYDVGYDGTPFVNVGMGGITYNVKVGNTTFGWAWGDHVEPGVSIKNSDLKANNGLMFLACIGNDATVVSACLGSTESKLIGATGTVTGKHGGAERVIVHFSQKVLDVLTVGDKIQIRACGLGLKFTDHPDIAIMNCSPDLLKAIDPKEKGEKVRIPVAKIIPGKIMGSGLGSSNAHNGDYDIQTVSPEAIKEYSLDAIRLGDLVAISDHDCTYGYRWQDGAMTVGIVIHGASRISGHGPGIVALFSAPKGNLEPIITRKANIADLLGLD